MIRSIVIDDEKEICERMCKLLGLIENIEVVAKESEPENGIKAICKLKPELAFVDIEMPRMSGFDVIREIRKKGINTRFILVTAHNNYAIKEEAFDYILKPADIEELKRSIERFTGKKNRSTLSAHAEQVLSKREKEVLLLASQGKTSREISNELFISKTTVDAHRKSIITKLNVNSITEAISKVIVG